MKILVIADDLTGANDTGLPFARKGLTTSVWMGIPKENGEFPNSEVTVIDTDSRSVSPASAYKTVAEVMEGVKDTRFDLLFKKVDSTFRGNISAELKALTDHLPIDFTIIAPAYPSHSRIVKNGHLYVKDIPVHKTEFADDPKNPMHTSYLPDIVTRDNRKKVNLLKQEDVWKGEQHILRLLQKWEQEGDSYIICDTARQEDLETITSVMQRLNKKILWVGSAGLAQALDIQADRKMKRTRINLFQHDNPVLTISGSVHKQTLYQLDALKADGAHKVIPVKAPLLIMNKNEEIERIRKEVNHAIRSNYKSIVICSSGEKEDVRKAVKAGKEQGLSSAEVSEVISQSLGYMSRKLLDEHPFNGFVLTGGDIARKVCEALGISTIRLLDQLEEGIPIGSMEWEERSLLTITKAGGFGSEHALHKAICYIRERSIQCDQL